MALRRVTQQHRGLETATDGAARGVDVTEIELSPVSCLADIAKLGLTLAEAKRLLARVQQALALHRPTTMQFFSRTAHPAAVHLISGTGRFIAARPRS
jgi:hypothetical protein